MARVKPSISIHFALVPWWYWWWYSRWYWWCYWQWYWWWYVMMVPIVESASITSAPASGTGMDAIGENCKRFPCLSTINALDGHHWTLDSIHRKSLQIFCQGEKILGRIETVGKSNYTSSALLLLARLHFFNWSLQLTQLRLFEPVIAHNCTLSLHFKSISC